MKSAERLRANVALKSKKIVRATTLIKPTGGLRAIMKLKSKKILRAI